MPTVNLPTDEDLMEVIARRGCLSLRARARAGGGRGPRRSGWPGGGGVRAGGGGEPS